MHQTFERSETTVTPYFRQDGTYVSGHYRQGSWATSPKFRRRVKQISGELMIPGPKLLVSLKCNCCHEPVFVHRSQTQGCVVYDSLAAPWPVHRCWKLFSELVLQNVAEELIQRDFTGEDYHRDVRKLKKLPKQKCEIITGFVFSHRNYDSFSSGKKVFTANFLKLAFVPSDSPDGYLEVFVPASSWQLFEEQTVHRLRVSYLKHRGIWRCFAEETTPLQPGLQCDQSTQIISAIEDRCVWCGKKEIFAGRWGFEDRYRIECNGCGTSRGRMLSDEFKRQISRWAYNSRRKIAVVDPSKFLN
jgi:hypothetical protein